ncbi:hypothetical protein C823_003931 [Eubacterium plexicaudatum ASF492]|nr:hypothetical protein C823_003931 [Eubacterium plexicaudatum ASF492]
MWLKNSKNSEKSEKKPLFFKKRNMPDLTQEPEPEQEQNAQQKVTVRQPEPEKRKSEQKKTEQDVFECKNAAPGFPSRKRWPINTYVRNVDIISVYGQKQNPDGCGRRYV